MFVILALESDTINL